jgi:hypothetical protein
MTFSTTMRVCVPEHTLVQEIEGEAALLNLDSERYFGLDDVGTRMWMALKSSESIQQAHELLLTEYDVEPEQLQQDLFDLIQKLIEHDLVRLSDQ